MAGWGKWFSYVVFFVILFIGMCGCSQEEESDGNEMQLWVITEQSTSDGMNLQAQIIGERMEAAYPGLRIQLDILPTEGELREIQLKQLRTKVMSGNGPDVYLLPVGNVLTTDHSLYKTRTIVTTVIEPLFYDVTQAMHSGVFLDISKYYDADAQIGKNALKPEIMDAGVYGASRYVLPLRYDMPVVLSSTEIVGDTKITNLVQTALEQNNREMAIGIQMPDTMRMFPQIFDYEKGSLLISWQDIANYMRMYQSWAACTFEPVKEMMEYWEYTNSMRIREDFRELEKPDLGIGSFNSIRDYILYETYWYRIGLPLFACDLSDALQSAAIAKVVGHNLYMYPMKTADGKTVAEITYFGAMGSSCKNPELAYEFLREFLSEEFQWESYRPRGEKNYSLTEMLQYVEPQTHGFVESSFPVRTHGAASKLWDILQYQEKGMYSSFLGGSMQNSRVFQNKDIYLEDKDIAALWFPIDVVRFPIVQAENESLTYALKQLNEENGTPTDANIDELAQSIYQNLWWHLAEG